MLLASGCRGARRQIIRFLSADIRPVTLLIFEDTLGKVTARSAVQPFLQEGESSEPADTQRAVQRILPREREISRLR
jgi:hypothetical protein